LEAILGGRLKEGEFQRTAAYNTLKRMQLLEYPTRVTQLDSVHLEEAWQ
jgi:hypothetical protein